MAGQAGDVRQLIINGTSFQVQSENAPKFFEGGRVNVEVKESSGIPIVKSQKVSGKVTGLELGMFANDGSRQLFVEYMELSTNEPLNASITLADGSKYVAIDGGKIVQSNIATGDFDLQESTVSDLTIVAVSGRFERR